MANAWSVDAVHTPSMAHISKLSGGMIRPTFIQDGFYIIHQYSLSKYERFKMGGRKRGISELVQSGITRGPLVSIVSIRTRMGQLDSPIEIL